MSVVIRYQARDVALLDRDYRVSAVQIDMFSHSTREVVTLLVRR